MVDTRWQDRRPVLFTKPKKRHSVVAVVLAGGAVAAVVAAGIWYNEPGAPGLTELERAWSAVQSAPRDPVRWGRLGDAQTAMDELLAAEHSYRTALRLGPNASLAGRLGFLLYARGNDDAALPLLEQAQAGGADLPLLSTTVATLRRVQAQRQAKAAKAAKRPAKRPPGHPPTKASPPKVAVATTDGPCIIPTERTGPHGVFRVAVQIEEREAQLIVDTGASLTAIAESYLSQRGIRIDEDAMVNAITATGPTRFPTARLESLEVGGRRIESLTVAVCTECGGRDAVGLLGLDVQAALGLEMDLRAGHVRLLDCEP